MYTTPTWITDLAAKTTEELDLQPEDLDALIAKENDCYPSLGKDLDKVVKSLEPAQWAELAKYATLRGSYPTQSVRTFLGMTDAVPSSWARDAGVIGLYEAMLMLLVRRQF